LAYICDNATQIQTDKHRDFLMIYRHYNRISTNETMMSA